MLLKYEEADVFEEVDTPLRRFVGLGGFVGNMNI